MDLDLPATNAEPIGFCLSYVRMRPIAFVSIWLNAPLNKMVKVIILIVFFIVFLLMPANGKYKNSSRLRASFLSSYKKV